MKQRIAVITTGVFRQIFEKNLRSEEYELMFAENASELLRYTSKGINIVVDTYNIYPESDVDLLTHNTKELKEILDFCQTQNTTFVFAYDKENSNEENNALEIGLKLINNVYHNKEPNYTIVATGQIYGLDVILCPQLKTFIDDIVNSTTVYIENDSNHVELLHERDLISGFQTIFSLIRKGGYLNFYNLQNEESLTEIELAYFLDELTELELEIEYKNIEPPQLETEVEKIYPEGWTQMVTLEEGILEIYKNKDIPTTSETLIEKQEEEIQITQEAFNLENYAHMPIPKDPYDNPREFIEDHSDFKDDEEQELYENSHSASLSTKNVDDYLTTYIPGEKIYRPAGVKGYIPPESYYPSLRDTHQEPLKTEVPQPRKQYASQVVNNNPYRTSKYNVKNRKKVSVVLGAILAVILTLPSMFYSSRLNKTLQYIERSTRAISSYDFTEAENSGLEAQKYIEKLRKTPAPVKMFFKLSGSEESELSNTIDALDSIANSQTLLAQNDVLKGIFSEKSPDVLGISNISSNTGDLSSAVSDYEQAISTYDNLESKILKGFLENAGIRDIDIDNIKSLRNISPVLYQILGYEDSQKYLILVQNEKYQSSTGGIAEDYQIVSIENGNIEVTKTGDVSEIDNIIVTLEEPLPAPLPLSKALGEEILTLQNANWEPDIKKNSKDIVYLYEIAMQEKLDGVVYLTTEYRDIFKTAYQYGINPNTADRFKKGLKDKEIIIYNKNNKIQSALALNNWTGEIKEHSDDYLYILDSGLNGKDNESEIISEAEYKVFLPDEERGFLRELKVTYANSGSEDYLNHIRVLVPRNAFLKNAKILSGNVEKNIGKKIQVSLYGNKALYETDLLIEAGSDLEIIFEYESTESFVGENSINFVFQKQPGKPTFPILFYVEYNNDVSNMDFESGVIKVDPNTIKFPVNIDSDKEFNLPL